MSLDEGSQAPHIFVGVDHSLIYGLHGPPKRHKMRYKSLLSSASNEIYRVTEA